MQMNVDFKESDSRFDVDFNVSVFVGDDSAFEKGQEAERKRFWDGWQENGTRKSYTYAFQGKYWNNETFTPKHDMVPTAANYMFAGCGEIDLIGALERCGVVLDFSKCQGFGYMLSSEAKIKHFPTIDLSAAPSFQDGFRYAPNLQSVSFVNVAAKHTWSNAFTNCFALVDVSFSGTIGKTISFVHSSLLSDASIQSIIDALADLTGQTAVRVSFHTSVIAKLTETQINAIYAKNWTI